MFPDCCTKSINCLSKQGSGFCGKRRYKLQKMYSEGAFNIKSQMNIIKLLKNIKTMKIHLKGHLFLTKEVRKGLEYTPKYLIELDSTTENTISSESSEERKSTSKDDKDKE